MFKCPSILKNVQFCFYNAKITFASEVMIIIKNYFWIQISRYMTWLKKKKFVVGVKYPTISISSVHKTTQT